MICNNCKKEMDINNNFCPSCGAKKEEVVETNSTQSDFSNEKMPQQQPSSYNSYTTNKKRKAMLPLGVYFLSFGITFGVGLIIIAVLMFTGKLGNSNNNDYVDDTNKKSIGEVITGNSTGNKKDNQLYDYKYSYDELPDVVSLDSDKRFTYSTVYPGEAATVYSFLFNNDKNITYADFILICSGYSQLLQQENDFVYEKEYSEEKYEETGIPANYLTRGNFAISITPGTEDSLYYAYISIFDLTEEPTGNVNQPDFEMPNYDKYLADREMKYFTYDETVSMENGLFFAIYDIFSNYPGDGTMTVDITLDLSSWYSDYYSNNGDFMILPFDEQGNVLSDAIPIIYVTNSQGALVPMPFLVNSTTYETYTFTYAVPIDTAAFRIYASNVLNDESSPVYVMDVGY